MSAAAVLDPVDSLLSGLSGVRKSGRGWTARCPAHEDGRSSLSISRGREGRALVKCHAGCSTSDVAAALGIELRDLFADEPEPAVQRKPQIVAVYPYRDESGTLLYEALRYDPKDFRQRRPDGRGGYVWSTKDVRRVPYRLAELRQGIEEGRTVLVVEGEKDVDRLHTFDFVATCNVGGAEKWTLDLCPHFRGARVVIVPDLDPAGRRHAVQVARMLDGIAADWRIVDLPGLAFKPKGGPDVSDWFDAGHTPEELKELARHAAPGVIPWDLEQSAEQASEAPAVEAQGEEWPEPQPIPNGLPAVQPFSALLLPEVFRPWLTDIADRMQVPLDYLGVSCMTVLAAVVGRRVGIRPKRADDWTVVPNLWGVVVGRPGVLKTPAVLEVMRPVRSLESAAAKDYQEEHKLWEAEQEVLGAGKAERRKNLGKQLKASGGDARGLARQLMRDEESSPEPKERRYIVNDSTVEKLGEILADNPNGVLIFRDELVGFLRGLDRDGREADRAFYLEAWNGAGSFTYDRIGRGTKRIESATVSVLGCIQPGPLRDYIKGSAQGGGGDDGLIQRFQLAVWPDVSAEWRNVDRIPHIIARQMASDCIAALARLRPQDVGAEEDQFDPEQGIPFLRFAPDAQEAFDAWRAEQEPRWRSGAEHPAFESHIAKYRSLVPSLALLLHLANGSDAGAVGLREVLAAIGWAQYLESHARRLYSAVMGADHVPARELLRRIQAGDLADGFTLRDVYRNGWTGLADAEEVQRAAELLEDLGWVRAEQIGPGERGGRRTVAHRINPRVTIGKKGMAA